MGDRLKRQWHEMGIKGEYIGRIFFAMGFSLLFVLFILILLGSLLQRDLLPAALQIGFLGIVLGLFSVGLGFTALGLGTKSEQQMRALANLEFDNRLASMKNLIAGGNLRGAIQVQNVLKPKTDAFLRDLRSMAHVSRWASEVRLAEARHLLAGVPRCFEGLVDSSTLDEVRSLCNLICGRSDDEPRPPQMESSKVPDSKTVDTEEAIDEQEIRRRFAMYEDIVRQTQANMDRMEREGTTDAPPLDTLSRDNIGKTQYEIDWEIRDRYIAIRDSLVTEYPEIFPKHRAVEATQDTDS